MDEIDGIVPDGRVGVGRVAHNQDLDGLLGHLVDDTALILKYIGKMSVNNIS